MSPDTARSGREQPRSEDQEEPRHSPRTLLVVLVLADLAFAFQQTAVIPAIPTVQRDLGTTQEWSTWLLSAYLIVATVATPALARLADLRDRRNVLVATLALFFVGSVVATVAPNIGVLVLARALQGFGGAVFPLSLSLARGLLPADRVGRGVALLTGAFGAGTAIGFVAGGIFAEYLDWRVVFGSGAVAIAIAGVVARLVLPPTGAAAQGRYDTVGTVLLGASAVALLLALTLGVQLGWTSWPVLALFAGTLVAGAAWVRWELRHDDPIVDLRLFRDRAVLLVNVASIGLGWSLFGSYLLIPRLVQADASRAGYGLGASAALTGLLLLPAAVTQTVTGPLAGRVSGRVAPGQLLAGGLATIAVAAALLAVATDQVWLVLLGTALLGVGAGAGIEAASSVATSAVDSDIATESAAVNSTVRRFAGGLGSQVSVIVLTAAAAGASGGPAPHRALVLAFGLVGGLAVLGAVAGGLVPRDA